MKTVMKIYEYQAKKIFSDSGITVPRGRLVTKTDDLKNVLQALPFSKYILKAQTYTGGRGKAGLIVKAESGKEAIKEAESLFKKTNKILVEEQINIAEELYVGFTLDRSKALYKLLFSLSGGMEIEEQGDKIITKEIDVWTGLLPYQLREVVANLNFNAGIKNSIYKTIYTLYEIFIKYEATLCEINPLALTAECPLPDDGNVVAIDAKIIFDDDALFRHPEIKNLRIPEDEDPLEREAKDKNLSYVKLSGDIGCMVNGAGLAMATMDVLKHFGGSPSNFLDIGGSARREQVEDSLSIINRDTDVKAIFINIFGGIVRCDEVAEGIVKAKNKFNITKPIVIRLIGTNDSEGWEILKKEGINCYKNMSKAAKEAVSYRNVKKLES